MSPNVLKCLIFALSASMLLAKPLTAKERHEIGLQCQKQEGIDSKAIKEAMEKLIIPNEQKYKNFIFCSYKKQGYQDEDGNFIPENLKEFLSQFYKEADRIVDNCMKIIAKEPTELAYLTLKCLLKEMQEVEANAA